MKIWKIISPKVLTEEERPDNISSDTQAKVKITKVMIGQPEIRRYSGVSKPKYPFIPGMFAVGVVTEAGSGCVTVEKNSRVFLGGAAPCGKCPECLKGNYDNCANVRFPGLDADGYLRDFIVTDESALSPLPSSVSDNDALFSGIVALCESVIDRLDVPKGTHIAVIGADIIGNILSQLLIWHQAVPILIDGDEQRLAKAAQCGIYYTLKAGDSLLSDLSEITGGRMAAGSVFLSFTSLPADLPFKLTSDRGTVVYTGLEFPEFSLPMKAAMDKNLTLTGAESDYMHSAAAINLLVNKALTLNPIYPQEYPLPDMKKLLEEKAALLEKGSRTGTAVINLI